MKKTSILMLFAVAASLFSCTAQSPKANLKTDVDTLSYAMGVAHTQGLREYLLGQVGMDSTQMNTFIKGLNDGMKKTSKKDEAYMVGLQIGQQINKQMIPHINRDLFGNDSTQTISIDNFMAGFIGSATNKSTLMTADSAQRYAREHTEIIKEKAIEKQYGEQKAEGIKFLEDNKNADGIHTTESGLQYRILTEGNGEIPKATDRVKVNYRGTLIDGTEFDSSYKRNEPATFAANQVIAGWTEALTMMPVGSKWMLYIPQELAYGARNQGTIPPYSTLIFEVELVEIVK